MKILATFFTSFICACGPQIPTTQHPSPGSVSPTKENSNQSADSSPSPENGCAGSPLYSGPPYSDGNEGTFYQPQFGAMGTLQSDANAFTGYSAVLTVPGQPAVHGSNWVAAWLGMTFDDGLFVQNGYQASAEPGVGSFFFQVWTPDPANPSAGSNLAQANETPMNLAPGQQVEFKAELSGTTWTFSYLPENIASWMTQGSFDAGAAPRSANQLEALVEMWDTDNSAGSLAPVTFSSLSACTTQGDWKPIEVLKMDRENEAGPRFSANGDALSYGFTTDLDGQSCPADGATLW